MEMLIREIISNCKCHTDLPNINGDTPLHLSSANGHSPSILLKTNPVSYICMLVTFNFSQSIENAVKETPLHIKIKNGHVEACKMFTDLQIAQRKEELEEYKKKT